ncbi:MAG TPA: pyruvate kinase [Opitutaceae bacterium]|jgi:pyruvate kinase|nr:pyruvate kinase [Opitutaceae bacterium]HOY53454.1 pyruvate kinase [Opitutaceae bacterium]HPG16296.1 pyruvate kinase [Opitutaceae bacterium]HPN99265.1 pyruvate kinase [Opitutaceae bacterium]
MPSTIRRTKIIFTLGPATESEEMLEKLIRAGADVIRLNMAHAKHDWTRAVIKRVREVSRRVGRDVAIMMDIKGPEIRTGDVAAPIELKAGEIFDFTVRPGGAGEGSEEIRSVNVNYQDLVNDIKVGDIVLVDSGLLRFEVLERNDRHIRCKVLTPGQLTSRRHINLPGVKVNLPSFTDKDRGDALVGLEAGIDFIAMSFVREAADIEQLREFLRWHDSRVQIIAKIEDQSAIANLDEIVRACDVLMVARGDLGIECPYEELPIIQRRAVQTCQALGRPVIIATHMLESMITQPMPTRAEITDVANAVYELADCVMLSGETTVGRYPLESVLMLDKISRRIEADQLQQGETPRPMILTSDKMKVLRSAVVMANELPGSAILTFTRRGFIAQGLAALRPLQAPILAFTPHEETFRQMRLLRAIEPWYMPFASDPDTTIENAINMLRKEGRIQVGARLVVATDLLSQNRLFDSVQLRTVK